MAGNGHETTTVTTHRELRIFSGSRNVRNNPTARNLSRIGPGRGATHDRSRKASETDVARNVTGIYRFARCGMENRGNGHEEGKRGKGEGRGSQGTEWKRGRGCSRAGGGRKHPENLDRSMLCYQITSFAFCLPTLCPLPSLLPIVSPPFSPTSLFDPPTTRYTHLHAYLNWGRDCRYLETP